MALFYVPNLIRYIRMWNVVESFLVLSEGPPALKEKKKPGSVFFS